MKFKMAPNSLFAVLLRKPWWVSFAIALAFPVLSFALMPPDMAPFGAMGGVAFFVLAGIALVRQWNLPSARRVEAVTQAVSAMGWEPFRNLLEQVFRNDGYEVERVQGAADLRLRKSGRQVLVTARRWKAARHGAETVAALHGAMLSFDAGAAMYVALGELTPHALEIARERGITVIQGEGLAQLLRGVSLS